MSVSNPHGTSTRAKEGMTVSTHTTTVRNLSDGSEIITGLGVDLTPGMVVEWPYNDSGNDYIGIVESFDAYAAVVRLKESGRTKIIPRDQLLATIANNVHSTPRQESQSVSYPELQGEENLMGDVISDMDRRYGVPVPIGATVLAGELDTCVVIGGNDELAILLDSKGKQHAERWGALHVQASGPAFTSMVWSLAPAAALSQQSEGGAK